MKNKSIEQKSNIYMVTGINESFLKKAEGFIKTMNKQSNVNNIVVTLEFTVPPDFSKQYPNIKFTYLSGEKVKAPNPNTCLQHGAFLPALKELPEDSVVIFTDADISVQRGFSPEELEHLSSFNEGDIGVGYNEAPSQTLIQEMSNLDPLLTPNQVTEKFPKADLYGVFNTGVLIAEKKTYQQLYDKYVENWDAINTALGHYAKQQWLLSYLIQNNFTVKLLPDEIHTHDHHPIELRVTREYGHKFCIKNTPVVFSHRIPGFVHPSVWNNKICHHKRAKLKWKRIACSAIATSITLSIALIVLLLK